MKEGSYVFCEHQISNGAKPLSGTVSRCDFWYLGGGAKGDNSVAHGGDDATTSDE